MASTQAPNLGLYHTWDLGESGWNTGMDTNLKTLDAVTMPSVVSATTTAEPGSPTAGDRYILPASATGTDWAGNDGKLAVYAESAWAFYTAKEGWQFRAVDTGVDWLYESSAWAQKLCVMSSASGITASTTQSQGQEPLTSNINEIATCATTNDVVTAPALLAGMPLTIINNGAQTLQVYPASGEDIGAGTDTSITITAGNIAKFEAYAAGTAVQII
jgi:hypothetical protein